MLVGPHSGLVDFVVWEVVHVHVAGLNTTSTPSVGGHAQREGGRTQQEQAQHAHPDQPHADSSVAAAAAPDQPAAARDDEDDDGGHDGGTATGAHAVAAGHGETPQAS